MKTVYAAAIAFFILLSALITTPAPKIEALASTVISEGEITRKLTAGEDVFARIFSDDVYIFSDEAATDGIFILPRTYFVKITEYSPETCRAVYCYEDYDYARSVYGFVKTRELTFVSDPPRLRSFPLLFPEFEGKGYFYKNNRFDSTYSVSSAEKDAFFYGYYLSGNGKYCYVLQDGKFGYYSADLFGKIDVPAHPDPKPAEIVAPSSDDDEVTPAPAEKFFDDDARKAVFIAVTCVVAVGLTYLIFLPRRRKEELPDEED